MLYVQALILISDHLTSEDNEFLNNCDPNNFVIVTDGDEKFPRAIKHKEFPPQSLLNKSEGYKLTAIVSDTHPKIYLFNGVCTDQYKGCWPGETEFVLE